MMTINELTAWQHTAPWPKRSQVEQDLRLCRAVTAIFSDSLLKTHLAMRGGTVLHKAHLAPAARYSEDIDLVLIRPIDPAALDLRLREVLTPVIGKPSDSKIADAWLAVRNVLRPSKILRTAYRFIPLGLNREETVKVEVNLNEGESLYPLVKVMIDTMDCEGNLYQASVVSYDVNEMLGTKTRALMQRDQGRDLFDLQQAWTMSEADATPYRVSSKKAMDAFVWYLKKEGTEFTCEQANEVLDGKLRKPSFCRDMNTLLRPGLPKFDPHAAAVTVRETFFSHLQ